MGRVLALLAVAAVAVLLAGCGGEDVRFPNAKVVQALDLKQEKHAYAVGGSPFCKVTNILNDSEEVDSAPPEYVLASPGRHVGIQAKPPFSSSCEKQVRRALTRIDPRDG
jgi:hypothetical protein